MRLICCTEHLWTGANNRTHCCRGACSHRLQTTTRCLCVLYEWSLGYFLSGSLVISDMLCVRHRGATVWHLSCSLFPPTANFIFRKMFVVSALATLLVYWFQQCCGKIPAEIHQFCLDRHCPNGHMISWSWWQKFSTGVMWSSVFFSDTMHHTQTECVENVIERKLAGSSQHQND